MRKKLFLVCVLCFGLLGIISITNVFLSCPIRRTAGHEFGKYYQYSGAVHIHTTYSDGGGTYEEIGRVAESLGLDFIIPSDHNTVQPFLDGYAKHEGKILVLPTVEISTNDSHGHFLVIGDSIPLVPGRTVSSDSVFHDALYKDSMIILAHVFHPNRRFDWDNWNIGEFTGIEMFNLDSNWRNNLSPFRINRLLAAFISSPVCDHAINRLVVFPDKAMKKFDELSMKRKMIGIGSLDAHSRILIKPANRKNDTGEISWRFPPYKCQFELAHTIIVTREPFDGDYGHDRTLLMNAIRNGNMYVGFSGFEEARGFLFTASSDSAEAIMGESLTIGKEAKLSIVMPDSSNITVQLVRNGSSIGTFKNRGFIDVTVTEPGVYRVQAFQNRTMLPFFRKQAFPWILSNPIYLVR